MTSGSNGDGSTRTATLRTSSFQGRPWREKGPDRRLPLFRRMSKAIPVSPAHFPLPTTTGEPSWTSILAGMPARKPMW